MAGDWRAWSTAQVAAWLDQAGFAQYAETFRDNEIAGDILPELTNEVLRDDLGIQAFGHRARIAHAIKALLQQRDAPDSAPSSTPSKPTLDLLVLHAAPLVIQDATGKLYPMEKLDLDAERRAITTSLLMDVRHRAINVRFEVATADLLRQVMTTNRCRVLHFSGHGLGVKPALCFEDSMGCTQLIPPEVLRDLTVATSSKPDGDNDHDHGALTTQLVFVNSCHSERVASVFLEAGIPHVVAVHSDSLVVDASATMFAKHFYLSLFSGDSVRTAFEVAKGFVRTIPAASRSACCCAHLHEPSCPWMRAGSRHTHHSRDACCCKSHQLPFPHNESSKFLLLSGDNHEALSDPHDTVLFGDIPNGALQDHTPRSKSCIPSLHGHFLGRAIETYRLVKSIRDHALTACIGAPGIGKSSLVISVAHFVHTRRMFPDGVFYVDLEGQNLSTVRFAIAQSMGIAAPASDDEIFAEIGSQHCLLILDKAEELLDENEEKAQLFLGRMVTMAPHLRLLIASRRIPHIANTTSFSLSLPQLSPRAGVELLRLMAPSCPAAHAQRLAAICGFLPLAIRVVGRALANARATVTPEQMTRTLEADEYRLETMKELNQVGHVECVDRCVRSSFCHLDEPLRLAFMALGLFRGSFDLSAVEAVLNTPGTSVRYHRNASARSNSLVSAASAWSSSSSLFPLSASASRRTNTKVFVNDAAPAPNGTGLGTKLAKLDGYTFENDGVFTSASYELMEHESIEEIRVRSVDVTTATAAISHLHEWSLVEHDSRTERYRMHNLIQLFAEGEAIHLSDSSSPSGDLEDRPESAHPLGRELLLTWRRRFTRHYCVVVANASHSYRYDGDLSLFDKERANIESAMSVAHQLTQHSIDRMREARRNEENRRLEEELSGSSTYSFVSGGGPTLDTSTTNDELQKNESEEDVWIHHQSALTDVVLYCNLVTRARFILRTRMEPKQRLEIFSKCLQLERETRSLYCSCGCSENEASNLLWDIDEVKFDRPLGILDKLPDFRRPVPARYAGTAATAAEIIATAASTDDVNKKHSSPLFSCTCPGAQQLLGLEVLLLLDLGYASCDVTDWMAGEYYYLEVLRLQRDVLGWGENAQVAEVLNQFGICLSSGGGSLTFNIWMLTQAEKLLTASLMVRRRVLSVNHPEYATSLNNLANFYKNTNPNRGPARGRDGHRQNPRAPPRRTSTNAQTEGTPLTHGAGGERNGTNKALAEDDSFGIHNIEDMYRRSLRIREATLGECHPHVAQSLNNLALCLLGKVQNAKKIDDRTNQIFHEIGKLYQRALAIRRRTLGNSSFETAATLNNIGTLKRHQRDWKGSEASIREAIAVMSRYTADQGPRTARMYINLARLFKDQERYRDAIAAYERAKDIRQRWYPDSSEVGYCIEHIGKCMILNGETVDGAAMEAKGRQIRKLGFVATPASSQAMTTHVVSQRYAQSLGSQDSSPAYLTCRVQISDMISLKALKTRRFNFAGRLLGERAIHMKRIDAIAGARILYRGPWSSEIKKLEGDRQARDQLLMDAHIHIAASTERALQRAKDLVVELIGKVQRQWEFFERAH